MNTFKRKSLMLNVHAALLTAAAVVMEPVWRYAMDPRNGIVKFDGPSEEIKALEKSIVEKFKEVKQNLTQVQDKVNEVVEKEVKKYGDTIEAKSNDKLKELGEKQQSLQTELQAEIKKLTDRLLEQEQKGTGHAAQRDPNHGKTAGELFAESEQYKFMMKTQGKDPKRSDPVEVPRHAMKAAILNAALNNDQPLVQADRRPGIILPPEQRLMIRDVCPQVPTTSNVIEYVSELLWTSAAAPQGAGSSPAETEGQPKAEASLTFQLQNAVVITLAHWIPASRQVLSDAPQLAGYIDSRLTYGLRLEEEDEILNSTGAAGELNGIRNQATDFAYGATNQTALDTMLKAYLQVSLSNYDADTTILHPLDWTNMMLLKDTTGRYLFSDPQAAGTPRLWGKNIIPTASMTAGRFVVGAFRLGCAIYDRESVSVRVSDQHSDFFTRNLVAILAEQRLAFVMYRAAAFVEGPISHAG